MSRRLIMLLLLAGVLFSTPALGEDRTVKLIGLTGEQTTNNNDAARSAYGKTWHGIGVKYEMSSPFGPDYETAILNSMIAARLSLTYAWAEHDSATELYRHGKAQGLVFGADLFRRPETDYGLIFGLGATLALMDGKASVEASPGQLTQLQTTAFIFGIRPLAGVQLTPHVRLEGAYSFPICTISDSDTLTVGGRTVKAPAAKYSGLSISLTAMF